MNGGATSPNSNWELVGDATDILKAIVWQAEPGHGEGA
jgi:hypothetical protein